MKGLVLLCLVASAMSMEQSVLDSRGTDGSMLDSEEDMEFDDDPVQTLDGPPFQVPVDGGCGKAYGFLASEYERSADPKPAEFPGALCEQFWRPENGQGPSQETHGIPRRGEPAGFLCAYDAAEGRCRWSNGDWSPSSKPCTLSVRSRMLWKPGRGIGGDAPECDPPVPERDVERLWANHDSWGFLKAKSIVEEELTKFADAQRAAPSAAPAGDGLVGRVRGAVAGIAARLRGN